MPRKKDGKPIPVESVKHRDKGANIPSEELREFVKADESTPKKMLYPCAPSLDTQLVQNWANRMILGDSLLVMSSLAEKEGIKEPPLRQTQGRQNRREGNQPLRRRGDEGLRCRELSKTGVTCPL